MEKKYQVFVSSTYEDLRKEREAVAKAILELGDIPVGMEMFSAADEEQWKLIRRQIDQSDYYVVLIAHRYGSMAGDVSFTEREYDYASQIGVPVLGFIIEPEADWPATNVDRDPEMLRRLELFKQKVRSRMVSFWSTADGLNSKVLAALSKQKNLNPRPGWIRAVNLPGPEVMSELGRLGTEIARLSEENTRLRERASIDAHYSLIDAMADDSECQALILMLETGKDLPMFTPYTYGYRSGASGSGELGGSRQKVVNAGLVLLGGNGRVWRLTDEGRRFAEWLINRGRKADYFWSPVGEWGELDEHGLQSKQWLMENHRRYVQNDSNPDDANDSKKK